MDERGLRSRSLGWAWTGSCQDWDNELFVISWHHMALISCTVQSIYHLPDDFLPVPDQILFVAMFDFILYLYLAMLGV